MFKDNKLFHSTFDKQIMAVTLSSDKLFTYVSTALLKELEYSHVDLLGIHFSKILSSAQDESDFLQNSLKNSEGQYTLKYIKKSGEVFLATTLVSFDESQKLYNIIFENESKLETTPNRHTSKKEFLHTILDEQKSIIVVSDSDRLIDVNKAFLKFFDVPSLEYFLNNIGKCISSTFELKENGNYIQKNVFGQNWIEYILDNSNELHKVQIKNKVFDINIVKIEQNSDEMFIITFYDITELEMANKYIEDSIEYAALIQHSLTPDNEIFRKYAQEYFVIWHPKDVVGGDIYMLEELRHDDEMLLFVIDCAGHGVPGAFVTMIVKSIERQIIGHILSGDDDDEISPAQLLGVFNRSMKHLLKQENKDSISNAGFDGGILYYNKRDNKIIYAGAKTPLFVMKNGELEVISGDRHSIGYKRSKGNYSFTDHEIDIDTDTTIYLSTDGYLDQQGEENKMPFGKKKVMSMINEYWEESLSDQQEVFLDEFMEHRGDRVANDDVTMVSLKFLVNEKGK